MLANLNLLRRYGSMAFLRLCGRQGWSPFCILVLRGGSRTEEVPAAFTCAGYCHCRVTIYVFCIDSAESGPGSQGDNQFQVEQIPATREECQSRGGSCPDPGYVLGLVPRKG